MASPPRHRRVARRRGRRRRRIARGRARPRSCMPSGAARRRGHTDRAPVLRLSRRRGPARRSVEQLLPRGIRLPGSPPGRRRRASFAHAWAAVMHRLAINAAGQPIPSFVAVQVLRTDRLGTEGSSNAIYLQPAAFTKPAQSQIKIASALQNASSSPLTRFVHYRAGDAAGSRHHLPLLPSLAHTAA
jgi:hypothetical protein